MLSVSIMSTLTENRNCLKSVRIRNISGLYFPAFGLNTEKLSVSLRIQSKCRKMRTRKTHNMGTFHAVRVMTTYAWSIFKEIIRYLKNMEIDNKKKDLQDHLSAVASTVIGMKMYGQKLIERAF